jgi:hypothetical protein
MFKNPMHRIIYWSVLTLITDFAALRGLYLARPDGVSIVAATIMSIALIYLIASYRIDGPDYMKRDERIRSIVDKSGSVGFIVLFICVWSLAVFIDTSGSYFLRQNVGAILASMAMIGLLTYWLAFVWYKYHV